MGKKATIEWAKKNGVSRVYRHRDGIGRVSFFATNDVREESAFITLVWSA
jgi:hypothetical protein